MNGYPAFSFYLYPSEEFCQELYKYGSDVEVHEPKWLREEFAKDAERNRNNYKKQ
ncbi:MAG: WYL domain-containing protein [Paludibacteraceae bacterium]|nr:WYL domain-containing protein [Paludibacteraceae bacterium]